MIKNAIKILFFCVLQLAVSTPCLAGNCLHPADWKDSKCIHDEKIPCRAGFYNIVTEGHGYGIGNLTYNELKRFFCRPCEIGYNCPGDGKRHKCEHAEEEGMKKCPTKSKRMKKIYNKKILCYAGFYNIMTKGHDYAIGKKTYNELKRFFCRPCEIGYYCPGDDKRYECEYAEEKAMDNCPTMSKHMKKIYNDLQSFRSYEFR